MVANTYTRSQIDKLGNAIIYLASQIKSLHKTKLLKLVYLIEEASITRSGLPFFGIDFQLWHLGPVAKDLYIEVSSMPLILEQYIRVEETEEGRIIYAKGTFCDDEFSDLDLEILRTVVQKYKGHTAKQLVTITHEEHRPWFRTAKETGYLEAFNNRQCTSTEVVIDLSSLLSNAPALQHFYKSNVEFQKEVQQIRGYR